MAITSQIAVPLSLGEIQIIDFSAISKLAFKCTTKCDRSSCASHDEVY
ncbi:hypothetical protein cce_0918 [Crocosphaera subtropica ATCC 51142]|uniref:Uncharacterized protein n=2 Tax=Crocosphaera TaxID=263510 RepID=B1WST9_CROS5|nr:hypothetical protein cce_0918 [Crocosphaera subtropica ATCC 51142]